MKINCYKIYFNKLKKFTLITEKFLFNQNVDESLKRVDKVGEISKSVNRT